jgi:hypothetical protein
LKITFDQTGDFAAYNAACRWCNENGISYGSMQGPDPIGLLRGNYAIAKWRNLSTKEREQLDGTITGDKRNGPVYLELKEKS